jgi:hypothetical protein
MPLTKSSPGSPNPKARFFEIKGSVQLPFFMSLYYHSFPKSKCIKADTLAFGAFGGIKKGDPDLPFLPSAQDWVKGKVLTAQRGGQGGLPLCPFIFALCVKMV